MGKRHYDFSLPEETIRGLKVFIVNKQGGQFKKGDLSKWLNIFINNGIQGYNTHAHGTHNANPYQIPKGIFKVRNLMEDICKRWVDSGMRQAPINAGNTTIPLSHLEQMIREVTGYHDKRAIQNHIVGLLKNSLISDKGCVGAFLILDTGSHLEWIDRVMEKQKQDEKKTENQQEKQANKEFDTIVEA